MSEFNIVGGVDISKWATQPSHEKLVYNTYKKLKEKLDGVNGSPYLLEQIIDDIIQNNPIVKKQGGSPVTAKMILESSKKNNVDPALIMSIAHVDSHYGTMGKAKKTRNPGNWRNDDSGNLHFFDSWEEGIDRLAWQLKRYSDKTPKENKETTKPPVEVEVEYSPSKEREKQLNTLMDNIRNTSKVLPIYKEPEKTIYTEPKVEFTSFPDFLMSISDKPEELNKELNEELNNTDVIKSLKSKTNNSGFINLKYE